MDASAIAVRITAELSCAPALAFQAVTPQGDPRAPSTRKMAERLEELAAGADPTDNFFLSQQRAALAERSLKRVLGTRHEAQARLELAIKLVRASRDASGIEQALGHLDAIARLKNQALKFTSRQAGQLKLLLRNEAATDPDGAATAGFRFRDVARRARVTRPRRRVPCRFLDERNGTFREVAAETGADRAIFTMSLNFGDLDNDGDQDLHAVPGGAFSGDVDPNVLFENPGHGARWITLRLRGVKANRSAIGARIQLRVAGPAAERSMHATLGTGGSFGSRSLEAAIGLGDATRIVFAEILWPGSSTPQRLEGLPLDRIVGIEEGRATFEVVPMKAFKLGRPATSRAEEPP